MDFEKKCAAVFIGGTVMFTFMAEMMVLNGDAVPGNPGWGLISTIRNIFWGIWAILLAAAAIFAVIAAIVQAQEAKERAIKAKQYEEDQRKEQIAREWRWIEEEKTRLRKREEELLRVAEARQAQLEARERALTVKQARTTEDAVDRALEDFG